MQITDVGGFTLRGPWPYGEDFWQERLVMPVDLYPKLRARGGTRLPRPAQFEQCFLQVSTDEGVSGIYGPLSRGQIDSIERAFKEILFGEDPFRVEMLGDMM